MIFMLKGNVTIRIKTRPLNGNIEYMYMRIYPIRGAWWRYGRISGHGAALFEINCCHAVS